MVRAKFKCNEIVVREDQTGVEIHLEPVISGSEENERFFEFTPWGKITMGTVNKAASEQFVVGNSYFVDFTPAE